MGLEKVMELWHGWEVRILVLLSLLLQVVLIIFGSRRKNTRKIWINLVVWLAYLSADWVATVSLGTLARSKGTFEGSSSQSNNILEVFWAPFLLLHLGGPDTITAYSLEDNELWLRHFLELLVQVGVAFYVFLRSWNNLNEVRFLAILMFITGVIKYGERTLVLRSSSAKQLKDSLRSSPDETSLDFDQIVEELRRGKELMRFSQSKAKEDESNDKRNYYLVEADLLFNKCRSLFADLILDHYERQESYFLIHNKSAKDAFKLVDVELGFMYDLLYTKATIIYSRWGIFLRCFCIFSHVSASVVFLIIIDKEEYSPGDVYITYVLLFGAVFLDVYALIILLFSDWTKLWLTKRNFFIGGTCSYGLHSDNRRRWSGSMGQYNILSFCLADISSKTTRISKLFGIKGLLEKYQNLTWKDVDDDLQERIFKKVLENSKKIEGDSFNIKSCKELLDQRGDCVLSKRPSSSTAFLQIPDQLCWSTIDVEFDHSLLLWHIATDLCSIGELKDELPAECKISKCISDYLLYLLVVCPTMLPKGNGEIRYRETCAEAMRFFKRKCDQKYKTIRKDEALRMLLEVDISQLEEIKGDRSLSVLYYGCKLTKELEGMKSQRRWSIEEFWKIISGVWIEMLTYAASHCGWKEHGRQIMKGGELLTHVCLLMAHFGLSEQYQIQKERFGVGPEPRVVAPLRRQNAFKEPFRKERFDVGPEARVVPSLRRQNAFKEYSIPVSP